MTGSAARLCGGVKRDGTRGVDSVVARNGGADACGGSRDARGRCTPKQSAWQGRSAAVGRKRLGDSAPGRPLECCHTGPTSSRCNLTRHFFCARHTKPSIARASRVSLCLLPHSLLSWSFVPPPVLIRRLIVLPVNHNV